MNLHKSHMVPFCASSAVWEILIFLTFDQENLGQGHMVEKLALHHLIAIVNLHNSHKERFCASSYRLEDIHISKFVALNI